MNLAQQRPAASYATGPAVGAIRVFVAEDHQITLWGLCRLIDASAPRLQLAGTARSRNELLNHDAAAQADVILLKAEPAETILRAIEKVHQGEVWLNRTLMGQVLGQLTESEPAAAPWPADPQAKRIASLTARERQIVAAMVVSAGAKQFAVAQEQWISEHRLRNHLTTIYSKLGVGGRLELHLYATAHGLGAAGRAEGTS